MACHHVVLARVMYTLIKHEITFKLFTLLLSSVYILKHLIHLLCQTNCILNSAMTNSTASDLLKLIPLTFGACIKFCASLNCWD